MFLILALSLAVLSIYWYIWRRNLMTKLRRNGIPGPKPHLIFGNFKEFQTKGYKKCYEEWIEKYGRIVGYYLGGKPFILIADPELLKLVQIKDFHNFVERRLMVDSEGLNPNTRLKNSLISCEVNRWKRMRSILTPTFSGAKLRQMTPIIESTVNQFMSRIDENSKQNKEFDVYELFQGLTMDTIAKTGFGFDSGSQESEDAFVKAAQGTFNIKVRDFLIFLWFVLPELRVFITPLRICFEKIKDHFGDSDHGFLLKVSDQLISKRRVNGSSGRRDMLQFMLEAESGEVLSNDKLSISTDMSNDTVIESKSKDKNKNSKMTNDEIAANTVLFFIAGYETTSTALAYVMHQLINHQDVQQKVREEVEELLAQEGKLDYNTVTQLRYMEQVIYETLRIFPPITTFIARSAKDDYPYKGLVIPKGVDCRVPLNYLQNDPELWSQPEIFDPERFSDENKHLVNPVVWQPFGVGPRNCIGMRFALLEIKLTLSKLLIKYRLIASEKTELGDISRTFKVISMTPTYGVFTRAVNITNES